MLSLNILRHMYNIKPMGLSLSSKPILDYFEESITDLPGYVWGANYGNARDV